MWTLVYMYQKNRIDNTITMKSVDPDLYSFSLCEIILDIKHKLCYSLKNSLHTASMSNLRHLMDVTT